MKLWIDDLRVTPDGYELTARTYDEAVALLDKHWYDITHISFDHDLGLASVDENGEEMSGYDVANYIEEKIVMENFTINHWIGVQTHTSNTPGRDRIYAAISYLKERNNLRFKIYNRSYESMTNFDSFGCVLNKK